jgi:hypothetical protein
VLEVQAAGRPENPQQSFPSLTKASPTGFLLARPQKRLMNSIVPNRLIDLAAHRAWAKPRENLEIADAFKAHLEHVEVIVIVFDVEHFGHDQPYPDPLITRSPRRRERAQCQAP